MQLWEVMTGEGKVRGVKEDGYTVFKGIPYARPPVGEYRFRPPAPPFVREGVLEADHFRDAAFQEAPEEGTFYEKEFNRDDRFRVGTSEDCLYLNIWTPAESEDENLPVAFWIHGGGFSHGNGSEMEFDCREYCRRNVILVSIQYRLGVFGFLAHPWLCGENERGVSGNYGILDQIAALRWVVGNIRAFGGDPENITVFGQSAGSISVQTLISTELTENWIKKAIFQSAGGYDTGLNLAVPAREAMETGVKFAARCHASSVRELRSLPPQVLLRNQEEMAAESDGLSLIFMPNIDGYVLEDGYMELASHGKIKDIPYMAGCTRNDIFVTEEMLEAGDRGQLYRGCGEWCLLLERLGRAPAYMYYFTRQLPGDDAGAFHSSELWYMFGTLDRCWRPMTDADHELSSRMLDCWTNFIKYGNPNGEDLGQWEAYTKENPYVQILDLR